MRDQEVETFRGFVAGLFAANGIASPRLSFPRWLVWHLGGVLTWVWQRTHRGNRPPVSRPMVALIGGTFSVDDTRARRELGYVGRISRADGLQAISTDNLPQNHHQGRP